MIRILAALIAVVALAASPKPVLKPAGAAFALGEWHVNTSPLDMNFHTGDFSAPNQIKLLRNGGTITGDRASGNYKSNRMTIYGHVVVHDSQGSLEGGSGAPGHSQGPSTLTADQVAIDGVAKVYVATGHVHYVQGDTVTDADKGTLNDLTHQLLLVGSVQIVQGERKLNAAKVNYNTITGQAHAEGNVALQFPGAVNVHLATPRPINLPHLPTIGKKHPAPSASPPR